MITLATAISRHGVAVEAHHDLDALIPVHDGVQRQGDVIVVPTSRPMPSDQRPIPAAGVAVVRGESGGNTHLLLADGPVSWAPTPGDGLDLGVLRVPDGAVAYLAHPEHAYTGIGPGTYVIRRQRERADVIRVVAD